MAIHASRPWYLNIFLSAAAAMLALWAAWACYQSWRGSAMPGLGDMQAKLEAQRQHIIELELQNQELRAVVQAGGSSLQIERTTQNELSKQVKLLLEENARLKQDITLFEGLAGGGVANPQPVISTLSADQAEGEGQYRYRFSVAMVGGRDPAAREFRGHYQLLVKVQQGGQTAIITVPSVSETNRDKFNLKFKQFQRIEGVFQVPEGAVPASVEARLLSDGVTRATKTVTL